MAETESSDVAAKWVRIQKRAGFCGLCANVLRDLTGHCSKRPLCKIHAGTRALTDEEWVDIESQFQAEQSDPHEAKRRRVDAAKERHAKSWAPPGEGPDVEYRMTFGKCKGMTVQEVMRDEPDYFKALLAWRNNILDAHGDLKAALSKEGVLDELLAQRPQLRRERSERILMREEDGRKPSSEVAIAEHPEIKRLRFLQQVEASAILDEGEKCGIGTLVLQAQVPAKSAKAKRKYIPTARILLPHCEVCGSIEHKRPACPHKDLQGNGSFDKQIASVAYLQNKTIAKLTSHLKYTQVQLRSTSYEARQI